MTNWDKRVDENGISALPNNVQTALESISSMPGEPAPSWLKDRGFRDIRDPEHRNGRMVCTHEDTPGIVYKISVNLGQWQTEVEAVAWFEEAHPNFAKTFNTEVKDYLIPVLDSDIRGSEPTWLIMPKATMGQVTKEGAITLVNRMKKTGWIVDDIFPANIGHYKGERVFVDYGQLKPVRFLRDNWQEKMSRYDWYEPSDFRDDFKQSQKEKRMRETRTEED